MTCGWIHWFEIPAANSGFCFFLHLAARINSNWRRPRRPTTDCANPPRYNVTGDESLCFIGSCWTWCEQAVHGIHYKAEGTTVNFSYWGLQFVLSLASFPCVSPHCQSYANAKSRLPSICCSHFIPFLSSRLHRAFPLKGYKSTCSSVLKWLVCIILSPRQQRCRCDTVVLWKNLYHLTPVVPVICAYWLLLRYMNSPLASVTLTVVTVYTHILQ